MICGGKQYALFMKSSDGDFVMAWAEIARMYHWKVRLIRNHMESDLEPRPKDAPKPSDDLLGAGSSLCGGFC
jgi:hypothetical protein